jgi:competence protein ComEC
VGQGDAILLRLPGGEDVLVDAGGFTGTDFDVGEKVVVPALLSMGVRHLDLLVLTHAHQDHGGGMPAVVEAFSPREIWMGRAPPRSMLLDAISRSAAEGEIPVSHPTRGSLSCLGESCFEVLHPPPRYRPGAEVSNDDSLVLRLTYRETAVLLSGDIEREGESVLLSSGIPVRSDLLKVPHHGSASSSSASFLDSVNPAIAVISVGEGNLWDHPSPQVVHRLMSRGVMLFRTDQEGAIRLRFRDGHWRRAVIPECN